MAPEAGNVGTSFTVTWAVVRPALGRVFDVQVLRPGSTTWADWRTDAASRLSHFTPAKAGKYGFRARREDPATGKATGWSPVTWVRVR